MTSLRPGLPSHPVTGQVVRSGLLKKLKTNRRKFFVLRDETPETLARLEYYDNEKKFRSGLPPKRSIALKTCFNINKRHDIKNKNVIALYTKVDCFCVVFETEEELQAWLKDMLILQHGEEMPEGQPLRPKFEYVWQVVLCERGLGTGNSGVYRLCLSDKTLTLIRRDDPDWSIEIDLVTVRSCGVLKSYFYLEIGRSSSMGAGEIWTEAPDYLIAYNIQTTVQHRFKACHANRRAINDNSPPSRVRSKTAESSIDGVKNKAKNKFFPGGIWARSTWQTGRTQQGRHEEAAAPAAPAPLEAAPAPQEAAPARTGLAGANAIPKRPAAAQASKSFRDRCVSMPSRPRTTSESHPTTWSKPYQVPHRPHLSDLAHGSPIGSPMSASDSTASSYNSLPDTNEHYSDNDTQKLMHSVPITPEEAIAEEDMTDFGNRLVDTSGYVPMGPPSGLHSNNTNQDYMPMSGPDCQQNPPDGYVPMNPGQIIVDGMTDMSPRDCNAPSNSASMSSITSGTPSTDIRFSDYPLDKVSSYFSAEEEERPARAYSVGSRPPGFLVRRLEMSGTPDNYRIQSQIDNSRVRALSVGAKAKKIIRVLPHIHHNTTNVTQPHNTKSNSAPLLASGQRTTSSHSSIGPMDDLMEMDFSISTTRPRTNTNSSGNSSHGYTMCNHKNSTCANNRTPAGYIEMKPGDLRTTPQNEEQPYVDMTQGQRNTSAYVDMTLGNANNSPSIHLTGTSPVRSSLGSPQLDNIDWNRFYNRVPSQENNRHRTSSVSSGSRQVMSPSSTTPSWQPDYLDMSGKKYNHSSNLSSSPNMAPMSPQNSDYMPLNFGSHETCIPEVPVSQSESQTPDGYMEMTPGVNPILSKHYRQSSLDSGRVSNNNDDYLNMSVGTRKIEKKNGRKDKTTKSPPITIHNTPTTNSSMSISSLLGNKNSTPPKMHLPISGWSNSVHSSLPRQKNKKSSSTIFKDTSSLISPTTNPTTTTNIKPTATPTALRIPAAVLNVIYKPSGKKHNERIEDKDTSMDYETIRSSSKENNSDYMNYSPAMTGSLKKRGSRSDLGDYAVMKPGHVESTGSGSTSPLTMHLSQVALTETSHGTCFRPISERDERLGVASPRPGDQLPAGMVEESKSIESANMDTSEETHYERLRSGDCVSPAAKISRPSSSNSDKIKTTSPRAFSSSEKLSRPPSVCSDTKLTMSRPGSTSSVYSSSSCSTVVGCSRPESVNSDRVTQLHYASLEIAALEDNGSRSPRAVRTMSNDSSGQGEPTFVYSEIDFIASENLRADAQETGGASSFSNVIR